MSQTRRSFLKAAASLSGGALLPAALSRPLFAACADATRVLPFSPQSGQATLATWQLGNCELRNVVIAISDSGVCTFQGEVCTHLTHTKDVWHLRLTLKCQNISKTMTNPPVVTVGEQSWDGPAMSEKDKPLFHPWKASFKLTGLKDIKCQHMVAELHSCC